MAFKETPISPEPERGSTPEPQPDTTSAPAADDAPPCDDEVRVGAAAVGATAGLLLTGNVFLSAAAGGAAAYATTREGKVGTYSRAAGVKAVAAYRKAFAYCRRHNVPQRAREAADRFQIKERVQVAVREVTEKASALAACVQGRGGDSAPFRARDAPSSNGRAAAPAPGAAPSAPTSSVHPDTARPVVRGVPVDTMPEDKA